jgi:ABC-type dipeptide/oligopeptide/nickel transport system permease subunit
MHEPTAPPRMPPWKLPPPVRLLLRHPLAVSGAVVLLLFVAAAVWPARAMPHDPYAADISLHLLPPSWEPGGRHDYLFGTDALGRDIVSTILRGARYSLGIVSLAALLSLLIGVAAGVAAGFYRGWIDELVMRLVDIQLAFPLMVLIVAVVAVLGPSFAHVVVVLGIAGWAPYARIVRSTALSLREREFVDAARAVGVGDLGIMIRHLLPNTMTPMAIFTTVDLARLLLLESALSYLGLGVQPPTPSWGAMIADGSQHLYEAWHVSALPGLAIVMTALAFNLLGDGLRDVLDPLTRHD